MYYNNHYTKKKKKKKKNYVPINYYITIKVIVNILNINLLFFIMKHINIY